MKQAWKMEETRLRMNRRYYLWYMYVFLWGEIQSIIILYKRDPIYLKIENY